MTAFLDAFGSKRRQAPRVVVAWQVEIAASQGKAGLVFCTCDASRWGLRLQGNSAGEFRTLLSDEGRVIMRLHLPDCQEPLEVEAELRWGLRGEGHFLSGWRFTRISHAAQKALDAYIAAHPEQLQREPGWR